jgi:hypothetical protein
MQLSDQTPVEFAVLTLTGIVWSVVTAMLVRDYRGALTSYTHRSSAARVASRSNLEGLPERRATVRRMQSPTGEILSCLDLDTMVSEDLCSEGGHSSGRLSEAS